MPGLGGELRQAYRSCLFTVFPSLCEGWGLPVAESLVQGKFCVASNCTSIPEVGGDLIDYFDPTDDDDALAKIERVLLDPVYLAARRRGCEPIPAPNLADCVSALVGNLDQPPDARGPESVAFSGLLGIKTDLAVACHRYFRLSTWVMLSIIVGGCRRGIFHTLQISCADRQRARKLSRRPEIERISERQIAVARRVGITIALRAFDGFEGQKAPTEQQRCAPVSHYCAGIDS